MVPAEFAGVWLPRARFVILRKERAKSPAGGAHNRKPPLQCYQGNIASLAAAELRAARGRFRRPPATILGPRRASLLAPSRNLFANE